MSLDLAALFAGLRAAKIEVRIEGSVQGGPSWSLTLVIIDEAEPDLVGRGEDETLQGALDSAVAGLRAATASDLSRVEAIEAARQMQLTAIDSALYALRRAK